jgi:hypothetical protein
MAIGNDIIMSQGPGEREVTGVEKQCSSCRWVLGKNLCPSRE